ncbi:helix-turn-helix domain-containing protein [Microbaculum sp. FT89]|uniref:helix-turn-helix domain-containing protein n=1 Tax=Microbaculum sp. FT89 TaxID=3447298 RepID=UPI003F529BB6
MGDFRSVGGFVDKSKFKKRPRYSVVLHDVREKLDISLNTYVVIDSIHKLSTSDPRYPYCIMSKDDLADFLQLGRATVFRSLQEAEKKGLIARGERGVVATDKWIKSVEIYEIKKR